MSATDIIEIDPRICGARPVVKGTRLEIKIIIDLLDAGVNIDDIIKEYPFLERKILEEIIKKKNEIKRFVEASNYFEVDPNKLGGIPVVKGTRLPVKVIYDLVDQGYSPMDIIKEYDFLSYGVLMGLLKYRDIIESIIEKVVSIIEFQHS